MQRWTRLEGIAQTAGVRSKNANGTQPALLVVMMVGRGRTIPAIVV